MTQDYRPHALYRFYSDSGQLLYVGITNDPPRRLGQHTDTKDWWHDVAGMTVEWHPDRTAVLAAEKRAILVESPKYNVVHSRQRDRAARAAPQTRPAMTLLWTCATCQQQVTGENGYIHVNVGQALTYVREWATWEARQRDDNSIGFLLSDAPEVDNSRWLVHHGRCDPKPDEDDYWFYVQRASTHAHLLNWTAHLIDKYWLAGTNWGSFIQRAASVDA